MTSNPPKLVCRKLTLGVLAVAGWSFLTVQAALCAEIRNQPEIYTISQGRETGFHFGRFQFHLLTGLINSWDSNVLFSEGNPEGDYIFEAIPGADLLFQSSQWNIRTGYRFTYRDYARFNVQDNQDHRVDFNTSYGATRRFKFEINESLNKSSDPADIEIPQRLDRFMNEASAQVKYETPGQDFDVAMKYTNTYQRYDATLSALTFYSNKVYVSSRVNISSRFRFLPKSVASINTEYGTTHFRNNAVGNSDSKGFRAGLNLNSQFSRKFTLAVQTGVTAIYFDTGPNATSFSGGVNGTYLPSPNLTLSAGFNSSLQISSFTNYYNNYRSTLDAKLKLTRKLEVYSKNTLDLLDFSGPNTNLDGTTRQDFVVQNVIGGAYALTSSVRVWSDFEYDWRSSNAQNILGDPTADFMKHKVRLGVDLYY